MEGLTDHDIEQWRALRACIASLRLVTRTPIVIRPVAAMCALVRRAAVRLHAARCDLGDAAAALTPSH